MRLAPCLASLVSGQPRFYLPAWQSPGRHLNINCTVHTMKHSPIAQKPTTMKVNLRLQRTCQVVCHFYILGVFNVASNFLATSVFQLEYEIIHYFPGSNIRAVLNMR